jgi:NAD(P)-dependent dehydrogenase (short-subunit alcohol dehydrogenase family)
MDRPVSTPGANARSKISLDDRVAIVTGGGSGIGRACAVEFGERGAKVMVSDVDLGRAEQVAASIKRAGGAAAAAHCDVSDEESVRTLVEITGGLFGPVNLLHNNAALTDPGHQILDLGPTEVSLEV